jgi:hypothetical protein
MCASCGCGLPEDQHGDNRHILLSALESAALAARTTVLEVARNILEMAARMGR